MSQGRYPGASITAIAPVDGVAPFRLRAEADFSLGGFRRLSGIAL